MNPFKPLKQTRKSTKNDPNIPQLILDCNQPLKGYTLDVCANVAVNLYLTYFSQVHGVDKAGELKITIEEAIKKIVYKEKE